MEQDRGAGPIGPPRLMSEEELSGVLLALCREILRLPDLDADAHFFRSGGTSLRAAQLVTRLNRRTGVKLSLRDIFGAPTPRSLARAIAARNSES